MQVVFLLSLPWLLRWTLSLRRFYWMAWVRRDWPYAGPSPLGNPLQYPEGLEWSETYRDGVRPAAAAAAAAVAATAATIRHERLINQAPYWPPLKNRILFFILLSLSLPFPPFRCGLSARAERAAIKGKREASKKRMETRPRLMRRRGAWLTLAALFHPF